MSDAKADAKEIFLGALDCASPEDLARYLDAACHGDAALQHRVEELLRAHREAGSFLGGRWTPATQDLAIAESPGALIGRYKLLQQIGEGGFGVVFMAEQQEPVRRLLALKIIKLGMDTRQVVARFEAERQALAMMDHPNVAKVLDGGATETGRPFFVMELVKGTPITEYCDKNNLSVAKRLDLFAQVCQAVQHAHQKGLIHRDIKPTNVLVSMQDDRPAAKVIDFGVAKAMQARLTEKTLFTEFQQLVGTPAYMSPEQAEGGLDIDTRSDVYSLGVLLYELLAGSPPFDPKELRSKAFAEMQRIIREVEPPMPSTRLGTLNDTLPSVAAQRAIEPRKLAAIVRGELDWIVMRCLEKDRKRRYQTASALADDLQRYLSDQPVEARPATRTYRLKKFIRRNKVGVMAGGTILAALVVGLGAISYFAAVASREARLSQAALIKAEQSRQEADRSRQEAEEVNDFFANEVFALADPFTNHGPGLTMLEALDIAAKRIDGKFPNNAALWATLYLRLSGCYTNTEQYSKGVELGEIGVAPLRQVYGDEARETLKQRSYFGRTLSRAGRTEEGRALLEEVWATQRRVLGDGDADTVGTAHRLALLLMRMRPSDQRDLEVARAGYEAALRNLGPQHRATIKIESQLSWILRWRGKIDDALRYGQEAAELARKVNGDTDTNTLYARYNFACCLIVLKRYPEAIGEFQEIWEVRRRILGPGHTDTLWAVRNLIDALRVSGMVQEAIATLKALETDIADIKARKHTDHMHAIAELARKLEEPALADEFETAANEAKPPSPARKANGPPPDDKSTPDGDHTLNN